MKRKMMLMSIATSMLLIATVLSGATARVASADRSIEIDSTEKAGHAKSIDVQDIDIGGQIQPECFRFAIFADPQFGYGGDPTTGNLQSAVDEIITRNTNANPADDIKFVIVLGDLIQGERSGSATWGGEQDYRTEYEQVKAQLDRLELAGSTGAGIHYIPVIGNHDVWYKFGDYSTVSAPPDYPEELFRDYFGPQYEKLSRDLVGWTKQVAMPSSNPYNPNFAAPDLQNFAFDVGPYHFICLDFCARDDFDAIQSILPPTFKKFWGYADLNDFNNGTWQWLEDHLQQCQTAGIKNVIVFTHHPPIYELASAAENPLTITTSFPITFSDAAKVKGEMHIVYDPAGQLTGNTLSNYRTGSDFLKWNGKTIHNGTKVDRVEGDVTFAFNKQNYDGQDEYDKLSSIFSLHGITVVHWFSGHYHLKGFGWHDAGLNTDVTVVPSIMPASGIYGIQFTGDVTINEQASAVVTPQANPNGKCITIVHVHSTKGPDVFIRDCPWDNGSVPSYNACENHWIHLSPDIWVTDMGDSSIDNPILDQGNLLHCRVWNIGGATATNTTVKYYWADFGYGNINNWRPDQLTPSNSQTISTLAPGSYSDQYVVWHPATETNVTIHRCIFVTVSCSQDPGGGGRDTNWDNNIGWKNFTVQQTERTVIGGKVFFTGTVDFKVGNPGTKDNDVASHVFLEALPKSWTTELTSPAPTFKTSPATTMESRRYFTISKLKPGEVANVTLSITVPEGSEKDTGTIHIAGTIGNNPIGGISVQFVAPDQTPPKIEKTKPKQGCLYMFGREIMPIGSTVIVGPITVEVKATDKSGIAKVDFYVDHVLKNEDTTYPFSWKWTETAFSKHRIKAVAYDNAGNSASDEVGVIIFNIH